MILHFDADCVRLVFLRLVSVSAALIRIAMLSVQVSRWADEQVFELDESQAFTFMRSAGFRVSAYGNANDGPACSHFVMSTLK
eukprot:26772-Pleurochrysis_carterae.AAC.1